MSTKRTYETDPTQSYAKHNSVQVVSRSLFAVVERGDMPLDSGYGEAEIVEVRSPAVHGGGTERVRIDDVPQDSMATSPDAAARAVAAMLGLSQQHYQGQLGFSVKYFAG